MTILMCVYHRFVQRRCCISWKIESWFKEKVWNYYLVVIFATTQACMIHVTWIFHALPHNLQRVRPTTTGSREWKHKSQGRIGLRLFSKLSKVFADPLFLSNDITNYIAKEKLVLCGDAKSIDVCVRNNFLYSYAMIALFYLLYLALCNDWHHRNVSGHNKHTHAPLITTKKAYSYDDTYDVGCVQATIPFECTWWSRS